MAFIVEDGTGLAEANSYASEAEFEAYCEANGLTFTGDVETALVRATAWIDARYGARYPGTRKLGRAQGLGWPRSYACDAAGEEIPDDEVPVEIRRAAAAAALRELASPGSLAPDVAGGGTVKRTRKKLGSMETETEYADGAASRPKFPEIDGLLAGLIGARGATVRLVRA